MTVQPHDVNADLHAHSIYSDGTLTPRALVARAHGQGVQLFALTDHDEVSGIREAQEAAAALGLRFVPGVEVSVTFAGHTVHIVGLDIDPTNEALLAGLAHTRSGRMRRAQAMADGLAAVGIADTLDGALKYAGNLDLVSRTHFARYLVERGVCSDTREVFGRFLVEGKPGYVPHQWAGLAEAVRWIRDAGGVPILAHPARYKLTSTELWALFEQFREAGGVAVEVSTSSHSADDRKRFAQMARDFGLEASRGSDFHGPGESNAELGSAAPLPRDLTPVWHRYC
jgi:3',5'-nucleoside bisphosphate phosphatase